MDELRPGSILHLATVGGCGLIMAAFAAAGLRLRDGPHEVRLRRAWALATAAFGLFLLVVLFRPRTFDPRWTLPLHLCDLLVPIAVLALWSGHRWPRTLTYFWGVGLSTQAFLTPLVRAGPGEEDYWFFWIYHLQVVGAALYVVVVGGYRPARRDFLVAVAGTLAYAAVILPLDLSFGWNYGFLGRADGLGRGTLLDLLPPWPWRIPVMLALVVSGMALLWLAWPLARRLGRPRGIERPEA